MNEILNMPENIPQELLDKSYCVIILPSVIRFAIGFGASYGRGLIITLSQKLECDASLGRAIYGWGLRLLRVARRFS